MTYINKIRISLDDTASADAFARLRVSNPTTLFDSKQIFDNQPLFWDESLESGAGITSSHSVDRASTTITSTVSTAGTFTRQTFMRFNYQPGKSQLVFMTGILEKSGGGTGCQRRIGIFDDDNGLFFEDDAGTIGVTVRSNATGSPVDTTVTQASWNVDALDGNGPSGVTADWTKTQIFGIDFEWLGVGRVRFFVVLDGVPCLVHEVLNTNSLDVVYMSTPNLPLRFQMITTGSSPASAMECICCSVISEGGTDDLGALRYDSTGATHVNANSTGTVYAVLGLRLKAAALGATVKLISASMLSETNDNFQWLIILNPTVAGTFTYSDVTNSVVQTAKGVTTNTVTGGTQIAGGYASVDAGTVQATVSNAIRLGAAIDGTVDEMVLCTMPLSSNADIQGGLIWREIS